MSLKDTFTTFSVWLTLILLGFILWTLVSRSKLPIKTLTYNDLIAQIEKRNLLSAKFVVGASTAEVDVVLRDSGQHIEVRIARELIPGITAQLQASDVPITFDESHRSDYFTFLVDFSPFVLIVAFWFYMMREMKKRARAKPQS